MIIQLNKFGTTLTSRQDGKEAYNAFLSTLQSVPDTEEIEIDFDGVVTFTPSWADEFITPILDTYSSRVKLMSTDNPSVEATLRLLAKIK
ncbi:MAG: STAS-like domain-containing protein [Candidatus Magasanikbacteria bacterium]|nr:STAS-like domain-containing protein [Candidatus Magasanikbacteria bacterium]